jgi:hypothetical protein
MVKLTKKTIIIALIAFAILVLLILWPGLWWLIARQFNPAFSVNPAGERDMVGWKTYTDSRRGFEFKYPAEFEVVDNYKSPFLLGAKGEVAVAKAGRFEKSGALLAIDSFNESFMDIGGIDFSLDREKGSIGCSYGADCRIYLKNRRAVILAKASPNPAQMIDGRAEEILATLKFFEPVSGWRVK